MGARPARGAPAQVVGTVEWRGGVLWRARGAVQARGRGEPASPEVLFLVLVVGAYNATCSSAAGAVSDSARDGGGPAGSIRHAPPRGHRTAHSDLATLALELLLLVQHPVALLRIESRPRPQCGGGRPLQPGSRCAGARVGVSEP